MKTRLLTLSLILFSFSLYAQGDECATATELTIVEGTTTSASFNTSSFTASADPNGSCTTDTQIDAWYSFTSPVNGNLYFDFNTSLVNTVFYDGCGGAEIGCLNNDGFLFNVSIGDPIIMRASRPSTSIGGVTISINAYTFIPNDECATAEAVTVVEGTNTTTEFQTRASTASADANGTCVTGTQLDGWYSFTSPVNGNLYFDFNSSIVEAVFYDGCGGTEIGCLTNDGYLFNVSVGDPIIMRSSRSIGAPGSTTITINAYTVIPNDECATAEVITVVEGSPTTTSFDSRGATTSPEANGSCVTGIQLDGWYSFTSPINGNLYFDFTSSLVNAVFYDGCGGSEIGCLVNDGYLFNVSAGDPIIMRTSRSPGAPGAATVTINAYTALTNNECANAEEIFVASIGNCSAENVTVQLAAATDSGTVPSCNVAQQRDAWYSFEAPITGSISLNSNSGLNRFAVYEACGGTEIACFNNDGTIPGVVFGETYYIQVFRNGGPAVTTFCLEGSYDVAMGTVGACDAGILPSPGIFAL